MSNDNTPENKDLDPVVQAVVNALNDRSKFEPSYVKQNINEMSIADRVKARQEANAAKRGAAEEGKAKDWLAQRGISGGKAEAMMKRGAEAQAARLQRGKDAALKRNMEEEVEQTEELLDDNSIVVDIVEEDGQIVALDNGVLFLDDDLPGIEYIEQFYGSDYIESAINEATKPTAKPTTKPATKPATKPVAKPKPAPVNFMAQQPGANKPAGVVSQNATRTNVGGTKPPAAGAKPPAGASTTTNTKTKPKTKPTTPASRRTDAATKKEDKPSTTASNVTQRARDTKLTTTDLDLSIGDQLKATDKVVDQNIKDTAAKLKPGTVTKPSLLNRLTGGRLGKGATYTPGDASAWDDSLKDFGKKVTNVAADIKKKREDEAGLGEVELQSKKKPTQSDTTGPAATAGEADNTAADQGGSEQTQTTSQTGGGTDTSGGRRKVPINFRIAGQAGTVERGAYAAGRQSGEIESQDVSFNVRSSKTGERRTIKKGDPEYDQYMSRYKKMSQAVMEALIRMGAVLTEEGWMLNDELLESVYTEYTPVEMTSSYYYDATGRLRIMTESEWTTLGLANVILERALAEAMDKVGEEDEDVDNDGDSDKSDDYLKNRREKIAAKMKEMNEKFKPKHVPLRDMKVREVPGAIARGVRRVADTVGDVTLGQIGNAAMNATLPGMAVNAARSAAKSLKDRMSQGPKSVSRQPQPQIQKTKPGLGKEVAGDNIPEYDATKPQQAQPKKSAMMESNPFPWRK